MRWARARAPTSCGAARVASDRHASPSIPTSALRARLEADGFELDAGEEASIAREMTDAGRSSVRVNGRQATAGYVRELADAVAEIVGQHEAQHLLSPAYHLELLDRFAGGEALKLRAAVGEAHGRDEAATRVARAADARRARRPQSATTRRFHRARDRRGEASIPPSSNALRSGARFLDNVERIAAALNAAREALTQQEAGATQALGAAAAALASDRRSSATELQRDGGSARRRCRAMPANWRPTWRARRKRPSSIPPSSRAINARLALLERLARRYGGSLDEVVERARRARRTVDEFENRDELLERAARARAGLRRANSSDSRQR